MTQSQVRIGWRKYVDLGLDASATTFITAAGLTDETQKSAINTLVKDLKRFNLWSKIKAFYPFVGGSATSHKFNLIDPRDTNDAYRLTFSGGWTHSSMGAQCNGTNTTANTNLSLRTVLGATSYEHNLGFYINYYNPTWSYRDDMGAYDGNGDFNTNPRIGLTYDTNSVYVMNLRGNRQYFDFYFAKTFAPSGLTEMKRYRQGYMCMFKDGFEVNNFRSIDYNATYYNPVANVYIGSASSWSRYATAYITNAISTLDSYLMYIAVQRFNTTLGRQSGTGIAPQTLTTYTGTAPSLITGNLKVNLDTTTLTEPTERTLVSNYPGLFYGGGDIWSDTSGNGNNGVFEITTTDWTNRSSEYFKTDLGIPEVRMRNIGTPGKPYSPTNSPDGVYTTYRGSATGTFTFGGWVKGNSTFNGSYFVRGNNYNTTGNGIGIMFGGGPGGKFTAFNINATPNSGSVGAVTPAGQTALSSITTMQSDVWYFIYCVWKPSSYVKIYVNGQLETTTAITYPSLATTTNNNYGFSMNVYTTHYTYGYGRGIFGAMHVYDKELSAAEILQNFEATRRKYNV
jgi:hypothetical protein